MAKFSINGAANVSGGVVGGFVAISGLIAAVCCPLGGLVAGAYFTYTAVAATMPTIAAVALGAAGGLGGLVLGKIAAIPVALCGVAAGAVLGTCIKAGGLLVNAIGSGIRSLFTPAEPKAPKQKAPKGADAPKTEKSYGDDHAPAAGVLSLHVKPGFDAALERVATNENKAPAPAPKRPKFGFRI